MSVIEYDYPIFVTIDNIEYGRPTVLHFQFYDDISMSIR